MKPGSRSKAVKKRGRPEGAHRAEAASPPPQRSITSLPLPGRRRPLPSRPCHCSCGIRLCSSRLARAEQETFALSPCRAVLSLLVTALHCCPHLHLLPPLVVLSSFIPPPRLRSAPDSILSSRQIRPAACNSPRCLPASSCRAVTERASVRSVTVPYTPTPPPLCCLPILPAADVPHLPFSSVHCRLSAGHRPTAGDEEPPTLQRLSSPLVRPLPLARLRCTRRSATTVPLSHRDQIPHPLHLHP